MQRKLLLRGVDICRNVLWQSICIITLLLQRALWRAVGLGGEPRGTLSCQLLQLGAGDAYD